MKLHRLAATYGRLNHQTLELAPGLNILEAPNESGKSTWCAFLLSMLYGIDSRQRDKAGFIAEKNRYAPWSGTPMSGQLDCSIEGHEITLRRETRRANSPMGHFSAVYTGTGNTVPHLTAQNCGEELLGVPREVYERSAFIRQAGLGISANAELERRIVSLITTGDEGTSYTESCAALKKQLNRRRHNKTGELPTAETELSELRQQLHLLEGQKLALAQAQQERAALSAQIDSTKAKLSLRRQYDAAQKLSALTEAKEQAHSTREHADRLREELETLHIPENDTIGRLRGAIVNLETTRKALDKARSQRDDAARTLLHAEAAASEHIFAGLTPEQAAKQPLDTGTKPQLPLWLPITAAALGLALALALFTASRNLLVSIGSGCGILGAISLIGIAVSRKKRSRWEARHTELQQQRERDLAAYVPLYRALTEARADAEQKSAAADALSHTLSSNEQGILLEVRRFAPAAYDISAADTALRECAIRRKALVSAEETARQAQLRQDILSQQMQDLPSTAAAGAGLTAPTESESELEDILAQLQASLALCASTADRLSGQIAAGGDPDVLTARAEELESTIATLTTEYDAISLALSALDNANTSLQNRFSPALGRRAAQIFKELTGGRYSGVVLDRSFHLTTEPTGDTVYRDAQLLSAGASDQLYLAVRLAICEFVLPSDPPPLVLDDALTNYDDARCATALQWLRKEAEHRQILLFTCHGREAEFFRNDPEVRIQRLTESI